MSALPVVNVKADWFWRSMTLDGLSVDPLSSWRIKLLDLGFTWGDDSPAAQQLSIAILYSLTQSEQFAAQHYQDLCDQWTSKLPPISFEQPSAIDEWVTVRGGVIKYSKYLSTNPFK